MAEPEPSRTVVENPPLPPSVFLPSDDQQTLPEVIPSVARNSPQNPRGTPNFQGELSVQPDEESSLSPIDPGQPLQHGERYNQRSYQFQGSRDQLLSPVQAHAFSPSLPSALIPPDVQSYPTSNVFPQNPHKRQRTQLAVMPSLRQYTVLIEQHIASVGGSQNLNDLERPRMQLLEKACKNEDSFYVALHQLFCVWDFEPNEVAQIAGFPDITVLRMAFKIVGTLIRENGQLAPINKNWFAMFPSHLADLLRTSEPYRNTVKDVGGFLEKLASDWDGLANECGLRKYPPLVDELVNRLGLLSPILQGVVFTAARRNIGVTEGEFANRMEAIFSQDQMEHQALAVRYHTARPPSSREVQDRNQNLKNEYLRAYNQFMERQSATRFPTPVVPSNGHFQLRSQQDQHNNNWQHSSQQQPFLQQQQQQQQPSSGSPNPNMVAARRPQSVESQRAHPNTPSPVLLQGLTVNSPIQQGFQIRNSNPAYYPPTSGSFHQPSVQMTAPVQAQAPQMGTMSPQQHQVWLQHQQQQQHQHQQQRMAMQHINGQPQLEFIQQQQQNQQIQMQQHILNQGVASLNRAASRRESNTSIGMQQSMHSRTNSVSSGGRQTPISGLARPLVPMVDPRNLPPMTYEQALQANIAKYNTTPAMQRPLVPPLGYVQPSQPTNPEYTALHQAHLRSPRLVAADTHPEMTQDDSSHRYYQAVKRFALLPTKINSSVAFSRLEFVVSAVDIALTAGDYLQGHGQVPLREFRNGTLQYRLRCVQTKKPDSKCSISDWVVRDTVWPESASLDINNHHLEIRRKNHHGKDLPIDITSYVRAAGPNIKNLISMSITRGRTKMREFSYYVAVEVIEILGHAEILDLCQQSHIPASQTLDSIKRSLAGTDDEDDDFAMVVSDLAIDLADPFTARIFETPVRGINCLHRECFDLKTFLLTRNSKPKRPEQPCMIDVWKCPLCTKDARPYSLRIDDFLASVRSSLESQGLLDVKAIWIGPDGKWRPKIEERTGTADHDDSDDSSDGEGMNSRKQKVMREVNQVNKSKKATVEVIELDDD